MAVEDTSVKYFNSSMTGTSLLSNVAGSLITILDDCLVNGFGSVTLDSLVIADDVATGTYSSGHNFTMNGNTGPVITIAGATPSELNGEWRIASVPETTTFTFATEGISDQTATGTITAKRSPAGFSKVAGTNKASYRSDDVTGNRFYLRVDDSNTSYARIRGYETMSDIDTGTGLFPTEAQLSGGGYCYKATNVNRTWALFADSKMIYFYCDVSGNNQWAGGFTFGDLISFKSGDPYATILIGSASSTGVHQIGYLNATAASWMARAFTGIGTAITATRYGHGSSSSYLGVNSSRMVYPNPVDLCAHCAPVDCWDSLGSGRRGMMPGLFDLLHAGATYFTNWMTLEGINGLAGRTGVPQISSNTSALAFHDITGPWR